MFTVSHDGQDVGAVSVTEQPDRRGRLSWELSPGFTGQGYATRALVLVVHHAFRGTALDRVEALVETDDERGVRVATRSGLRREGVLRGHRSAEVGREDLVVLARLARLARRPATPGATGRGSTCSCPASGRSRRCWSATPTAGSCSAG